MKRSPVNPVNPERRAKRFERHYGSPERVAWVRDLPCLVFGCSRRPSQNAHVRSKAAGGGPENIVPLCHFHHQEQGQIGIETFARKYKLDLNAWAERVEEEWQERLARG